MSRVLRHSTWLLAGGAIILGEVVACWMRWVPLPLVLAIDFLCACVLGFDIVVIERVRGQLDVLRPQSSVRNVDCLIVGEPCEVSRVLPRGCTTYITIGHPRITLAACHQILRRAHGVVRDDGEVVFVLRDRAALVDETLHPIDTLYLHELTIRMLGLQRRRGMAKALVLCQPQVSLMILLGMRLRDVCAYVGDEAHASEEFCAERGLTLRLWVSSG